MLTPNLSIKDFIYYLPEEKIAKYPLAGRDESKLLRYRKGEINENAFSNLAEYLQQNSLLVFNDTKVIEARLIFIKTTGTSIELFCLEPDSNYTDITSAMLEKQKVIWKCLVGGAKKWKDEILTLTIETGKRKIIVSAKKKNNKKNYYLIEFSWDDDSLCFAEILQLAGKNSFASIFKKRRRRTR